MKDDRPWCPHCGYPIPAHDAGEGWTDEQVMDACFVYGMEQVREARKTRAIVKWRGKR